MLTPSDSISNKILETKGKQQNTGVKFVFFKAFFDGFKIVFVFLK